MGGPAPQPVEHTDAPAPALARVLEEGAGVFHFRDLDDPAAVVGAVVAGALVAPAAGAVVGAVVFCAGAVVFGVPHAARTAEVSTKLRKVEARFIRSFSLSCGNLTA